MSRFGLAAMLCLAFGTSLWGQNRPSTTAEISEAIRQHRASAESSLLADFPARNIGPTVMGGRITDLVVDPRNPRIFYLGFASGGVFKTTNNGQSFEPVFDGQGALGVGDLAISPSHPDWIWVGTGENNSSRSSYAGAGVFLSKDGGQTWSDCGLTGTQHIGRIILHPTDPQTAWVASMGNLYTSGEERGVYLTTDAGKSWSRTLFVNQDVGIIDLEIDPHNPQRLWAAAWERSRKAWEFVENGPGSAIYRSDDGGRTWSKAMQGLPSGDFNGRIGLAASPVKDKLYAVLDNQEMATELVKEDTIAGISSSMLSKMDASTFLKLSPTKLDTFLEGKGYPEGSTGAVVQAAVREGKYTVQDLANHFGDANNALFNTAVRGAEVYVSKDGGDSWSRTHEQPLTGIFYTYGYYFGQIRVSPDNADELYIFGVPMLRSTDGGKTWERVDTEDVHVDHHALWQNPADPEHLLLGNDGGLYSTYDRGAHWTHVNNLPVGQFYTVMVDMAEPYNVYGGLQDNGVFKGSSQSVPGQGKEWERLFGGDGMFVVLHPEHPDLVYTGFQFGNYFRMEPGQPPAYITPQHAIGQDKYRWNWRSPMVASPHNASVLYFGAQYLFRSMDKGETWERISEDLTTNRQPQGNVPYSTLTVISESPLKFGMVWVGTDDGKVQLTTDGGNTWQDRSAGLPEGLWVSAVHPSPHDQQVVFVALTGYRNDDFHTYLFQSRDQGKTWNSLAGDLPVEAVNTIVQDPVVPDLLYVGTDQGTYASLDRGKHWQLLVQIPNVASYDLLVHPREQELVVATHGRSIYIVDVKPLQAIAGMEAGQELMLYAPEAVRWSRRWSEVDHPWQRPEPPQVAFSAWVASAPAAGRKLEWEVRDSKGELVHQGKMTAQAGFNAWTWDLKGKDGYLSPGTYEVSAQLGFEKRTSSLEIKK